MENLNEAGNYVKIHEFLAPLKDFKIGTVVKIDGGNYFGHITGFSFHESYYNVFTKEMYDAPKRILQLKVLWMNGQEDSNVDFEDIKVL